jgi:flagellar motor switch protein FliN
MSNAAEPALRKLVQTTNPTAPAPTAQVLTMPELELQRAGGLEPRSAPAQPVPASPGALGDLHAALRHLKAKLTVCVGTAEITVGDLLGAKEQHVLRLDQTVEQPVDVLLEGQVVARGTLIAVDDHFGVRITELPATNAPGTPVRG